MVARRYPHTSLANAMPLNLSSVYPAKDPEFQPFPSRRSVVHSTEGIVACTQPLAARCGIKVLDAGGNAAVSNYLPPLFRFLLTIESRTQQ